METSREARSQSYRNFKNALYRRFEQVVEERVVEDRQARKQHGLGSQEGQGVSQKQQGAPAGASLSGNATASVNGTSKNPLSAVDRQSAGGTLEKLWPTLTAKTVTAK